MSSTFDYNATGSDPFADNTSVGRLLGCSSSDPGGEGGRQLRWGMLGLSILIVATASGNILVCLAVSWERRLQNMTNYFLMSLAIADLLVSLLVMPLAMIVEIFGCFPLDQSLCVIWATMDVLLCTASIWHMCTMSMDRYFTIRYPIRYGRNKTKTMMTLKITFVWIISFAVSAPLAIAGFVDYSNVYNLSDGSCVPSIKNFVLYGSIFAFYVPLIIMVTTYTLTIRILRQNRVLMAGLQGKYHFQVPMIVGGRGDRHPGAQRRLSKIESTRLSCPDLSPQRSDFTLTSVGMTSPKRGSSGTSTLSPTGARLRVNNPRNKQQQLRSQRLKVNLTDDANYVNCNFDPIYLKPTDGSKEAAGRHKTPSISVRLKALSPKHSKSRALRRGSQPNAHRSRIDTDDQWNPSLLLFRITRYYSDSNLASLQSSDYSPTAFDVPWSISDERRPNGASGRFVIEDQVRTRNGSLLPYPSCRLSPIRDRLHEPPTSLRLASSSSTEENTFDERYADFESSFMCFEEGGLLKRKAPSCLTTQTTTTTDTSAGTSPFPVEGAPASSVNGKYLDTFQMGRSWTLSTADGRGLEEKQRNGRELANPDPLQPPTPTDTLATKKPQHPNGSANKGGLLVNSPRRVDKSKTRGEVRGFPMIPTRRNGPQRPSTIPGSWSRASPSINTSPSSSEFRSVQRSRLNLGRPPRKSSSACARKIGLLSKNRTNNERKASKVLGIIFAVFVLSWTPFFTMNIVSVLCDRCMETITDSLMASMVWLGYLSSLANPIIYTMFSTSFRTVFYRILTCQYNQAVGCRQASRQSSEERFLCWSKSGRNSKCLKDIGCESKICGV